MKLVLICLLLINAAGLLVMLADKKKAQKNLWRIPEATLLTVAALGGSIGVLTGMYLFHHKTRKPKFFIGVPLILTVQLIAVLLLWGKFPAVLPLG